MGERVGVNVAVTKLITGAPDLLKQTLAGALLTDDSIPSAIVEGAAHGFNGKCIDFYNYGKNYFTEGLPGNATFVSTVPAKANRAAVITVLEGLVGEAVRIDELTVRTVNLQLIAKEWLQNTAAQNWEPILQVLIQGGLSYRVYAATFINGVLVIRLRRDQAFSSPITITTNITTIPTNEVYYHVVYHLVSDPYYARTYWNYKYSLGTYSTLTVGNGVISGTTFMPIAPIRRNSVNVVDDKTYNTQQKDSVRKLLRKIGMDLEQLTKDLVDPNDTDSLENVDEVFVMFGMDFDAVTPVSLAYLNASFRAFHYGQAVTQTTWVNWWNAGKIGTRPKNAIYISDSSVSLQLEWNFTTIAMKTGIASSGATAPNPFTVIPAYGNVLHAPSSTDSITKVVVIDTVNTPMEYNDERGQNETKLPGNDDDDVYNTHSIIYRRQVTSIADGDATNTYEEILIHGLIATYDVYRGSAKGRGEFVRDVTSMSDGGFTLPVSIDIVNSFAGYDETRVYYESLQVMVYARQIQHVAWYQTGIFAAIITVVVMAVALWFQQPWAGLALVAAIQATVIYILTAIIISWALTKAFTIIAKEIGGDLALVLAFIVAVYALTKGDTSIFGKLVTAQDFLMISAAISSGASAAIQDDIKQLMIERRELEADFEEKTEELEALELAEFGGGLQFELYDILAPEPKFEFDMNVSQWHAQKLIGNPGTHVLDLPRTYVDIALLIPETVKRDVNIGTTIA